MGGSGAGTFQNHLKAIQSTFGDFYILGGGQAMTGRILAFKKRGGGVRASVTFNTKQDQKDLLNLPLYRAMYFYIVM